MAARFRWTLTNLSDSSVEVLSLDPIGWDDMTMKLTRDKFYHGVFIDVTVPLKWHCQGGGKQFIDAIYLAEDIDAIVNVLIEMDCDGTGGYIALYTGRLNLASYKTDGEYTTCNIEKSDLFTKLNARDEISVDIESTTSIGEEVIAAVNTFDLPLTPIEILFENEWVIEPAYQFDINISDTDGASGRVDLWQTHLAAQTKADAQISEPWVESSDLGTSVFRLTDSIDPLLTINETAVNYPLTFDWAIDFDGGFEDDEVTVDGQRLNEAMHLYLIYGRKADSTSTLTIIDLFNATGYSVDNFAVPFVINTSGQITLNQGDSVWLAWYVMDVDNASGPFASGWTSHLRWIYHQRSTFSLSTRTTFNQTDAKSVLVHEAFNQTCDSIADANGSFKSDFYGRIDSQKLTYGADGCGSLIAITNGQNLRSLPSKSIFCTLKDLFTTFRAMHNIGLTIEGTKIRVEPLPYFYDKLTASLVLSGPVKVEVVNDNTRYINNIKVGYESWESEFKQGRDETATSHEYATKVNAVKGLYEALANYIASSYAIELTRRKSADITLEDWQYDNNNFIIALVRSSYGYADTFIPEIYSDSFSSGANALSLTTMYNVRLTPARMLQAHIKTIVAGLQIINGSVSFVNGEGNIDFEAAQDVNGCPENYTGEVLSEKQSFAWNDINIEQNLPLWLPEIYTFEHPLTASDLTAMRANPHGYIQVLDDHGNTRRGFILEADFALKTGLTKFTLLKMFE